MTLAKPVRFVIALVVGVAAVFMGGTHIFAASTDEAASASGVDMTFFYKNPSPERIAKLVVFFNTLNQPDKPSAQPPTIGFLAGPNEFDILWGASFASGDPRYALKILEHFATVANVDGNAADMVNVAGNFGTGADTRWLVQKRGANKAVELIAQSTALWALYSNSLQHEFVRSAVGKIRYLRIFPTIRRCSYA